MTGLSAADFERARSWAITIVETLLPDARYRDEGDDRRFLGRGGLLINKRTGAWYSHSAHRGSYSPLALVAFLKPCSDAEATVWIKAFLAANPGTGSCDGDDIDDDDGTPASAALAREYLNNLVAAIGAVPAEAYLKSRRLDPPFPACGYVDYARCGEGGLVGILTSHDRVVGLQVLYIDATGAKSTVAPLRRRCMLERSADAVFAMPYSGDCKDVVIAEGLEDALSIFRYGKRRCKVIGLPGIGVLRHLKFPKGIKCTIVRDGDPAGSAAAKALHDGIDRLILDGIDVYLTATPPLGSDANDILQQAGVDGLVVFLDSAAPAILSLRGEVERLAQIDQLQYAQIRTAEAKRLGIPVAILDAEVRKVRDRMTAAAQPQPAAGDDWADIEDTVVWPTPIDGAELLDDLVQCIGDYVVMSDAQRWATSYRRILVTA
jgi:Toprim domain